MILVIPLALGMGFVAGGSHTYVAQTEAVESAEPIEVEVLDTEIERERRSSDSGPRYRYTPVVEYRYEIDGETYVDDTVYPAGISESQNSRSAAEEEISRFEPEETAMGFADPDNPETSYLIDMSVDEITTRSTVFVGIGALVLLGALYVNFRWAARIEK